MKLLAFVSSAIRGHRTVVVDKPAEDATATAMVTVTPPLPVIRGA
jgi:hypothetical protein